MKAIGQFEYGSPDVLKLIEVPKPEIIQPRDILVQIKAVATNPVDFKKRSNRGKPGKPDPAPVIFGWDASGVVAEIGKEVSLFKIGDEVYFAGSVTRQGCNAEYCLVDERIVGRKPKNLSHEESAAIPLTGLTSWEALVHQMEIPIPNNEAQEKKNRSKTILITGGAGGVGSIAIQIAKKILMLRVIATGSREETKQFCKSMGADLVIDHSKNYVEEMKGIGIQDVDYIFDTSGIPSELYETLVKITKPLGKICTIVEQSQPINITAGMGKGIHWIWELMFTRSLFNFDLETQGMILNTLADLLERKVIEPRVTTTFKHMTQLVEAHKLQESGKTIGKIVISANFS